MKLFNQVLKLALTPIVIISAFNCASASKPVATNHTLSEIRFRFGSDELQRKYTHTLDTMVQEIQSHPDSKIIIAGHTDYHGTDDFNMDLGDRRARTVLEYFTSQGLTQDRLIVVTYGENESSGRSFIEAQQDRIVKVSMIEETGIEENK